MKKNLLCTISKLGVRAYLAKKPMKLGLLKRHFNRWKFLDFPESLTTRLLTETKLSTFSPTEQTTLAEFLRLGKQIDCVNYVKAVCDFYIKRHRFKFTDDVHLLLGQPTLPTCDYMLDLFDSTVGPTERHLKYFERSFLVRRRLSKSSSVSSIGPFNRYVKDQWEKRRQELRTVCLETRSTNVMKLLSVEWQRDPSLREQYKTPPMSVVSPTRVDTDP